MATTEELIAQLDPNRDYGERTFEQVIEAVRAGELLIIESKGMTAPLLRNAEDGIAVKGTGTILGNRGSVGRQKRAMFRELTEEDFPYVVRALVNSCLGVDADRPDPRSIKIFLQYFIGDPERVVEGASDEALGLMRELLNRDTRPIEHFIDVEGKRVG